AGSRARGYAARRAAAQRSGRLARGARARLACGGPPRGRPPAHVRVDRRRRAVTRARAAGLAGLAVCAAIAYLPALFASFVADDFLVLDASSRFRGLGSAFAPSTGLIGRRG